MEVETAASKLECHIAARLRQLRKQRGLTLDALAKRSGVSRAMISIIERAEASPTVRVLDKLAASLGVSLAALFADEERPEAAPLIRRAEQLVWRDPATGYIRRSLSPRGFRSPIDLVEVTLPAKATVSYDGISRMAPVYHQVWVMSGSIHLTIDAKRYALTTGDCFAFALDCPVSYRNPGRSDAHYLVATTMGGGVS